MHTNLCVLEPLHMQCCPCASVHIQTCTLVSTLHPTLACCFLQVLICVMLFMVAMILRHVLEKLIGYTCHEEAYFKRMRKALRHEYYVMALSEPPKGIGLSQRVMARMSMPSIHLHVRGGMCVCRKEKGGHVRH